jgi:penicillin amidase
VGPSAEIAYSKDGVLHARASTVEGVYFALGWATARDRAFQLELFRLAGLGRSSELLGNGALRQDGFIRSLGVPERARVLVLQVERQPFARRALEAYAAGVNARFDSLRAGLAPLPRDLRMAGLRPGRWSVETCMGVTLLQGIRLDADFPQLDFAAAAERIGRERAYSSEKYEPLVRYFTAEDRGHGAESDTVRKAAFAAPPGDERLASRALESLASALPPGGPGASNAWAAGSARCARHAPLLANDTHLGLATPGSWYAAHLVLPDTLDFIGLYVPGLPFFPSGRNRNLAWGVTSLGAHAFEAYRESLDVSGKNTLFQGAWEPIRSRPLGLAYGIGPVHVPLFWIAASYTRHGVVLSVDRKTRHALVVRWAATQDWPVIASDFGWEQAHTLREFRARLAGAFAPTLNWVVASRDGRLLYQAAGCVPRRAHAMGLEPTPGWTGEGEWLGPAPLDSMPSAVRGDDGVVASSNNAPSDRADLESFGDYTDADHRAWRVHELLGERRDLTVADFQNMQGDALSPQWPIFGRLMLGHVRHVPAELPASAVDVLLRLDAWDGIARTECTEPVLFRAWWNELNSRLDVPGREGLLYAILRGEEPASWIARERDPKTRRMLAAEESADDAVAHALVRAWDKLSKLLGPDPSGWTWARAHRAKLVHALSSRDRSLTPPYIAVRGDRSTVCVGGSSLPNDTLVTHGPSMRVVFDLADSSGWFIVPPGNSGDPDSPHYQDLLDDWAAVRYRKFDLAWPADAETESRGKLGNKR